MNATAAAAAPPVSVDSFFSKIVGAEKVKYIEENTLLTTCDIYKDAINATSRIAFPNALFNKIMNKYFIKNVVAWPNVLARIELERLEQPEKIAKTPICWLKPAFIKEGKLITNLPSGQTLASLPNTLTQTVHDSGYEPRQLNQTLERVLVGGSYFDPASREKNTEVKFIKLEIPQNIIELKGLGKAIKTIKFTIDDVSENVTIEIIFFDMNGQEIIFTSTRDKNFNFVSPNTLIRKNINMSMFGIPGGKTFATCDFFEGNPVKNEWFNEYGTLANQENEIYQITGLLFILCKELGDFLQGLCFKYYLGGAYQSNAAFFTGDKVLAARCIQDNIDVVLQEPYTPTMKEYKHLGRCAYYSYAIDPNAKLNAQKEALKSRVKMNNNILRSEIQNILDTTTYSLGGVSGTINDAQKAFLELCSNVLNIRELTLAEKIAPIEIDYDTANQLATACTGIQFLGNGKIKYSVKQLFLKTKHDAEFSENEDPIKGKNLGIIFKIVKQGGAKRKKTRKTRRVFQQFGGSYTEITEEEPTYLVFQAIYKIVKDDESANSLYATLFPYFLYEGIQPTQTDTIALILHHTLNIHKLNIYDIDIQTLNKTIHFIENNYQAMQPGYLYSFVNLDVRKLLAKKSNKRALQPENKVSIRKQKNLNLTRKREQKYKSVYRTLRNKRQNQSPFSFNNISLTGPVNNIINDL